MVATTKTQGELEHRLQIAAGRGNNPKVSAGVKNNALNPESSGDIMAYRVRICWLGGELQKSVPPFESHPPLGFNATSR